MLECWRCGERLRTDIQREMSRLERCSQCEAELHSCRQCRHFAPSYTSQCAHDHADPPRDREVANFCQYYHMGHNTHQGVYRDPNQQARTELESLFAEGPEATEAAEDGATSLERDPLAELKALFDEPTNDATDREPED